jgi:asparagine synthase (glutamine-hydrolysing)
MHGNLAPRRFRRLFPDLPVETPESQHFRYTGSNPDETAQWLRKTELERYLPKVLLKVDRGSMYHSLEVRVPLLDREVLDVASQVDWRSNVNLAQGIGKLTLRQSLKRHVSHQTLTKRGFTVPIDEWLRGPLRPIMEDLVLKRTDLLGHEVNRSVLAEMYRQHCNQETDFRNTLWAVLCLVLWEQKYMSFQVNAPLKSAV